VQCSAVPRQVPPHPTPPHPTDAWRWLATPPSLSLSHPSSRLSLPFGRAESRSRVAPHSKQKVDSIEMAKVKIAAAAAAQRTSIAATPPSSSSSSSGKANKEVGGELRAGADLKVSVSVSESGSPQSLQSLVKGVKKGEVQAQAPVTPSRGTAVGGNWSSPPSSAGNQIKSLSGLMGLIKAGGSPTSVSASASPSGGSRTSSLPPSPATSAPASPKSPPAPSTPGRVPASKRVTLKVLEDRYHLPLISVSRELQVSVTMLKKLARGLGITRWPYRQIRSVDKAISMAREARLSPSATDADKIEAASREEQLRAKRAIIIKTTSCRVDARTRHSIFVSDGAIDEDLLMTGALLDSLSDKQSPSNKQPKRRRARAKVYVSEEDEEEDVEEDEDVRPRRRRRYAAAAASAATTEAEEEEEESDGEDETDAKAGARAILAMRAPLCGAQLKGGVTVREAMSSPPMRPHMGHPSSPVSPAAYGELAQAWHAAAYYYHRMPQQVYGVVGMPPMQAAQAHHAHRGADWAGFDPVRHTRGMSSGGEMYHLKSIGGQMLG
jgi:hypothetical protein